MKKLKLNFIYGMKGYLLIELVIAMGLMLIIAMVITSILNISSKSLTKTFKYQNLNPEVSYAIEYIKDEIALSEYNYTDGNRVYFVRQNGNKYDYINYELKTTEVIRVFNDSNKLEKARFNYSTGRNVLIDKVDKFYLKDMRNYYELYIENESNKIKTYIAKRNRSL